MVVVHCLVGQQVILDSTLYEKHLATSGHDAMVVTHAREAFASRIRNPSHDGDHHSHEVEVSIPPLPPPTD